MPVLRGLVRALVALAFMSAWPAAAQPPDPATMAVLRLEEAAAAGDREAVLAMAEDPAAPGIRAFVAGISDAPTRFIIKERDRSRLSSSTERLLLEVFVEFGNESAITTWRADLTSGADPGAGSRIREMERLSAVTGLHRLELNASRQFDVRDLKVSGIDLTLTLPSGSAFTADIRDGTTAVVLLGRGRMRFAPSDAAERTQVRIFSGQEALETDFDAVFIRLRPSEFDRLFSAASLVPRRVAPNDLRRAAAVFEEYVARSLHVDLTDLSRDRWSLIPAYGDLIAEIRTRRLGSLTYTRSSREPEDISFFDRRRRRNIAVYASPQKQLTRGRFYSDDDMAEYDVLHYDIDATFSPERLWIDGSARVRLRTRVHGLAALTLRLADPLAVRSIVSVDHGRLLHLRVIDQNSIIVNFPTTLGRDTDIWLQIVYGGRLQPQRIDGEGIQVTQQDAIREQIYIPVEPSYLYSNRSYWYPQSTVTDYATARLQLSVPHEFDVVATGVPAGTREAAPLEAREPGPRPQRTFAFVANHPSRYLSLVISRFTQVEAAPIVLPAARPRLTGGTVAGGGRDPALNGMHSGQDPRPEGAGVMLRVHANPRQAGRSRPFAEQATSIFAYYGSLLGDAPYPSFTLALTESDLPGGHSPAYFAMLNQPLPLMQSTWRNDPVAFDGYPPFFLAHEIAHQWWGQAVGWKNYHEQWLSEGFAQYFAVLYAAQDRGDDLHVSMLRQMRRSAMEQSSQGPVYLGYRLGHIRGDGRVFRALVYNKGAMVLHMLRRLIGDDMFFAGVREFYTDWKFSKAGTDDLRQTMEKVSGQELEKFFDAWIYGSDVPVLAFSSAVSGQELLLRFEHRASVAPVPVMVTVGYTDGRTEDILVAVTAPVVEQTVPLNGSVRSIDVNRDHSALAEISRQGRPDTRGRIVGQD